MENIINLKKEIASADYTGYISLRSVYKFDSLKEHYCENNYLVRAYMTEKIFLSHKKHIYENDLILGSLVGLHAPSEQISPKLTEKAEDALRNFGNLSFLTNYDHYTPDFETPLEIGIGGMLKKIEQSLQVHKDDTKKTNFLNAAYISLKAFSKMIEEYADVAFIKAQTLSGIKKENLLKASEICKKISLEKPETFREALQLVWLIHTSMNCEGRFAMALGRMDQYLYPFYKKDIEKGILTNSETLTLLACTLYKIDERRILPQEPRLLSSDVVNIANGGLTRDGKDATNELSYLIVEAVGICGISGPNLSSRMHSGTSDTYWDKCLELLSLGIGYPAFMNDDVNIPALENHGYSIEDCRDYSMVGCIENFISGKQPPWSDDRYNSPKFIELTLNNGVCMLDNIPLGPRTGDASEIDTMDKFLSALRKQMEFGAKEYYTQFNNENNRYNREQYSQPYLSCFCRDCIARGLDINDGGAIYPSAHGPGCMGIGTFADSLAAIEKVVYIDKKLTLSELRDILIKNFEGHDDIRKELLNAPKYGNNDDFVDKYAVLFVDWHAEIFKNFRTHDGGRMQIGIASNLSNIPAGLEIAATPDGRKSRERLSDAASPTFGMDTDGITSSLLSSAKPDYKQVACGTVINKKLSSGLLKDKASRDKIKALLKVYFAQGGQEVQINCVSKDTLIDAKKHPDNYKDLVVRVSGFSSFYNALSTEIKDDIISRIETEKI